MLDKEMVRKELRETVGDEYDYDGEILSINAHLTSPTSAEVGHFVVKADERRNGYGSIAFEALLDVLYDDGVDMLSIEIQAVEDGSEDDPVMQFLQEYGFTYEGTFEHYNWGTCVKAVGSTAY